MCEERGNHDHDFSWMCEPGPQGAEFGVNMEGGCSQTGGEMLEQIHGKFSTPGLIYPHMASTVLTLQYG